MERSLLRFEEGIKSEATKKLYKHHLNSFLEFTKIKSADGLLQLKDSFLQELMEDYLFSLKKRLNPNSVPQRFAALELFFSMNDKILNFKKIRKMFPASVKTTGRDYWTTDDIQKMLSVTKTKRMIAIIHFLASTGCRIGALPELKIRHVKEVENCKAVTLYHGSIEEYTGFLTPEASRSLDDYISKRRTDGEILTDQSPLFRKTYAIGAAKAKQVNLSSLKHLMMDLESKAGLVRTKDGMRYNIQIFHGFRKRFNTILKNNKEGNLSLKEKLMGHEGVFELDGTYYNPDVMTLFSEFKLHISNLTISDKERDKLTIRTLRSERDNALEETNDLKRKFALEIRELRRRLDKMELDKHDKEMSNIFDSKKYTQE